MDERKRKYFLLLGEKAFREAVDVALVAHYPAFELDSRLRTRITVVTAVERDVHEFMFEYQELMDHSWRRIVDLRGPRPVIETFSPVYAGVRRDFVDVEWEFVIGHIDNRFLREKISRRASDPSVELEILLAYDDPERNSHFATLLRRRLPSSVNIRTCDWEYVDIEQREKELEAMARYLNYFYQFTYDQGHVPVELPEDEVNRAWEAIENETLRRSNYYNVMSIPEKMRILGHDRDDWATFYALAADEIEKLTAVEHNRWTVERLIQGMRPCTDAERREIEEDMRLRLADPAYASAHPVSLKKKYKNERNAHFDLCSYSELGVDETGLPVTRYDRDLTAAIPLIVKTYHDRHCNG